MKNTKKPFTVNALYLHDSLENVQYRELLFIPDILYNDKQLIKSIKEKK
jgi:hypothetical protein